MNVILKPIDERNREAVLALSVRDDQPFVADNRRSLEQAAAYEQEAPGSGKPRTSSPLRAVLSRRIPNIPFGASGGTFRLFGKDKFVVSGQNFHKKSIFSAGIPKAMSKQ